MKGADGPMPMNLSIGGGRSNDAIGKRQMPAGNESVNMAVIIGKDKRSTFQR